MILTEPAIVAARRGAADCRYQSSGRKGASGNCGLRASQHPGADRLLPTGVGGLAIRCQVCTPLSLLSSRTISSLKHLLILLTSSSCMTDPQNLL